MLGRVERIKELYESVNSSVRTQINAKKLVEACQNVHDLLHFPEMSLKAYETRYPDPEGTSLKERLATAQDSLAKNVMNDIDEILKKEPFSPADLLQAFKLLEMLNRTKEGVIRYSAFLNQQGENYLKTLMKSASIKQDLFYSVQLGKMFDYAAKSLTWSFEHVIIGDDASCGEHRQIVYMSYLQMVEDLVNTFIVEGFIVDKKLNGDDFCKQLPVLDLTLAEIALISGQLENFLLFVREFTPKANSHQSSPLVSSTSSSLYQCETIFDVLNKLLVIYPKLETIYVEAGMRKAIEVNQPIDDGTLTSCVDDVFFLAKKCTMRSFSLHQSDVILAVCEVVHKHLSSVFGQTLGKSLKSLPGTLSDERAKSYMMNVNNLFAAVDFLQKLGEELLDVFEQLVSPDSSPSMYSLPASIGEPIPNLLFVMQKFEHIMTAYNQLTCQFEQIAKQSLQALINHHIKGKLKKLLAAIFKDVQFVGNEENSDLISQKYIAGHFELIHAIDACLTDATRLELYKLIASEIVKFWTKLVLSSKFNQVLPLQIAKFYIFSSVRYNSIGMSERWWGSLWRIPIFRYEKYFQN